MREADQHGEHPVGRTAPGTHPEELARLAAMERSHPDCVPLDAQAASWLLRAGSALTNALAEELRPLGLSPSAFSVLSALASSPDRRLEPRQIAERLLVSRPSVTGLLDTLESKGYADRRRHADDGRRVVVELSEDGHAVLEKHYRAHYAALSRAFGELSEDERATLVTLLRKVQGAVRHSAA